MAKRKKKSPYRVIHFRVKGKKQKRYFSNISNRFISKATTSKNWDTQGKREAFPEYTNESYKILQGTLAQHYEHQIRTFKELLGGSPRLQDYIDWLEDRKEEEKIKIIEKRMTAGLKKVAKLPKAQRVNIINYKLSKPKYAGGNCGKWDNEYLRKTRRRPKKNR